ncbi:hypothetical protein [Agromyces sp. NPDC058064]|uniref:DUF4760 domain-containing protein n=1 Tax=Agromyces sp. NPDC058064 TaxID=3346322 RepID=UPI0036D7EDBD
MADIPGAIALFISIAAFAFSLLSYALQRAKDRRDLFLNLHQTLIEPELQEGRRRLHVLDESRLGTIQDEDLDGYQQINRSLAMFDVFAMYVNRRYISEELALEEWGDVLARTWTKAEPFIEARYARSGHRPWPHLRALGPRAVAWAKAHGAGG